MALRYIHIIIMLIICSFLIFFWAIFYCMVWYNLHTDFCVELKFSLLSSKYFRASWMNHHKIFCSMLCTFLLYTNIKMVSGFPFMVVEVYTGLIHDKIWMVWLIWHECAIKVCGCSYRMQCDYNPYICKLYPLYNTSFLAPSQLDRLLSLLWFCFTSSVIDGVFIESVILLS